MPKYIYTKIQAFKCQIIYKYNKMNINTTLNNRDI